jgi:3-deoxy-7-phosphoheptulonate synthase
LTARMVGDPDNVASNHKLIPDIGNSQKNHKNQPKVAQTIGDQLREGETGIVGVMIESHINEGNQKAPAAGAGGLAALEKGISITDACVNWDSTVEVLEQLADAVRTRRKVRPTNGSNGTANGTH